MYINDILLLLTNQIKKFLLVELEKVKYLYYANLQDLLSLKHAV